LDKKTVTCIVAGGGHVGIHVIKALQKVQHSFEDLRIILVDKEPHHIRKVLLVKSVVSEDELTIPWDELFSGRVRYIQGSVMKIDKEEKQLIYYSANGNVESMNFDMLIVTLGSAIKTSSIAQGGIALTDVTMATKIRQRLKKNLIQAAIETDVSKIERLLSVAVIGAGISGIETSAELAYSMHKEASEKGLDTSNIRVYLVNSDKRLFEKGPKKLSSKLEYELKRLGVTVLHECKALKKEDDLLLLTNQKTLSLGECIWTLGLVANPILKTIGLPLTDDGQVIIDESYRVKDMPNVYSVGDCAHVKDFESGKVDTMTCKEGTLQAARLGKIIVADYKNRPAPTHKRAVHFYCFGLGPNRGITWIRKWNLNIILSGKLGRNIRKQTWDLASLVNNK